MKAIILPLDDRPVTYGLPQMICRLAGVRPLMPPRGLMGGLAPANPDALFNWLESVSAEERPQVAILCADSLLYGGLVSSRRSPEPVREVLDRVARLGRWRKAQGAATRVMVQSSIMRISDNYDAVEEKPYWSDYGRELFAWSGYLHRLARGETLPAGVLAAAEYRIPQSVRDDYLATRRRNMQANRALLNLVEDGLVDLTVFSLDDSGEVGLNVHERERLTVEAAERDIASRVLSYPGADEVVSTLLARWLVESAGRRPRVRVEYSTAQLAGTASRYEGQSIGQTVEANASACLLSLDKSKKKPDFKLVVHGRQEGQGDHIRLPGTADMRQLDTAKAVQQTIKTVEAGDSPAVVCDVAYANGSDPALVEKLLERSELLARLWGYAGWNTTGNSVGSAAAMGCARWFAGLNGADAAADELKRCLFVRLADDWAYQSVVRGQLKGPVSPDELVGLMEEPLTRIARALRHQPGLVKLRLPWQRTFEIEVETER